VSGRNGETREYFLLSVVLLSKGFFAFTFNTQNHVVVNILHTKHDEDFGKWLLHRNIIPVSNGNDANVHVTLGTGFATVSVDGVTIRNYVSLLVTLSLFPMHSYTFFI
jgi:hypothetical protein